MLVNEQISLHQLIEEGLTVAITGYGSIAHELPYLGIPVVVVSTTSHSIQIYISKMLNNLIMTQSKTVFLSMLKMMYKK